MDQWLIELARDAGVEVLQPVRCEQIVPRDTGLRPVREDVPNQESSSSSAITHGPEARVTGKHFERINFN